MSDRVVKVTLRAQVAEYQAGMLEAARSTRAVGSEAEKLAQKREAFETLGRGLVVVGAAVTAATALTVRSAAQWESAWAGVLKTVDGTPEQLGRVEEGLRGLTSVLPASHDEIAAVAEAAGQLGIQTGNVVAFTRTMIDLGETTNLSANDAATALARFTNIMGTSQNEVTNLGSAIVGLGNNYATTEAEILEMAMRLAGAGRQIGMSEGEVLGLATALSSVGIEAEAGGSAMSKVVIDIAASVEEGGERLEQFASISGTSAQQFAAQWKTDPGQALAGFVQGLAAAEGQGSSTLGVLAELGITEARMRDALLRSSSAAEMFAGAMAMGNEEFEKNNALTEEAAKRYETVESKIAIAGNAIRDAAISFGSVLAPMVGYAAEKVADFAGTVGDLPEPVLGALSAVTGLGGATALAAGMLFLAIPKFVQFRSAIVELGVPAERVGKIVGGVGKGLAIAGAVAAFVTATEVAMDLSRALTDVDQKTRDLVSSNSTLADAVEELNPGHVITDWSGALEGLRAHQENVFARMSGLWDENVRDGLALAGTLEELGGVLGTLARSNLADAQKRFRDYADQIGATDDETRVLLDGMGDYKQTLIGLIEMSGGVADETTIMKWALGEAGTGMDVASAAAAAAEAEYAELTDALDGAVRALGDIAYAAMEAGDQIDRAQSAVNRLGDAAKAEDASLYGLDDASIRLRDSMRDVETSHRDAADAILANGGTLEEATATWWAGRDAVIAMRVAKGEDEEAARAWADKNLGSAGEVEQALKDLADQITSMPTPEEIELRARNEQALAAIQAVIDRLGGFRSKEITLTTYNQMVEQRAPGWSVTQRPDSYRGNLFDRGQVQQFYRGGFPAGVYPGVQGGIHKFAESEMGVPWEAYISGRPEDHGRNVGVWMETGNRLGVLDELVRSMAESPQGATFTGDFILSGTGLSRGEVIGIIRDWFDEKFNRGGL